MPKVSSNKATLSLAIPIALKKQMEKYPKANWSKIARTAIEQQIRSLETAAEDQSRQDQLVEGWVKISPMRDGSGIYRLNGVDYKIFKQDLVTTSHRVAFLNGKEVARACHFTTLLKKLKRL